MREIKAIEVKAGMIISVEATRNDTWTRGVLTIQVSRDARHGQFQSWNDGGIYLHGTRDDGAPYPLFIYDLATVTVVKEGE